MKPAWRPSYIGLAAFVAIFLAFSIDQPIARAVTGTSPIVLQIASFVTWFGQGGVVLYPTAVLMLAGLGIKFFAPDLGKRLNGAIRKTASVFIVVAAAGLLDDLLKIIFGRARPYLWLTGDQSGFHFLRYGARFASFPSGHTTTSVAAAMVFGALFPRWRYAFWATALLIGLSRIVLDLHYLSDVIAGTALAWLVATTLIGWLRVVGWLPAEPAQVSGSGSVIDSKDKKTRGTGN